MSSITFLNTLSLIFYVVSTTRIAYLIGFHSILSVYLHILRCFIYKVCSLFRLCFSQFSAPCINNKQPTSKLAHPTLHILFTTETQFYLDFMLVHVSGTGVWAIKSARSVVLLFFFMKISMRKDFLYDPV